MQRPPRGLLGYLAMKHGKRRMEWTDWVTYSYLFTGVIVMFGPVLWLVLSSFKTESQLLEYPPTFLPYSQMETHVEGYDHPLPLVVLADEGTLGKQYALRARVGLEAQLVDPMMPMEVIRAPAKDLVAVKEFSLATENYIELFERFQFASFLRNSLFITVVATALTLLFSSMAAFALSKYNFRGNKLVLALIVGTLMIPHSVVLVPLFVITKNLGLFNSLWGVILPAVSSPTGVFLLRQYMLTIPDEVLDAARMDKASEWKIFWRIILPLSAPALAVLGILSVMWRWNEFLWPLIVLADADKYTLQLALNSFQGEHDTQWSNLLAMTVLTLLPVATVFVFLQKYITTGTAAAAVK